MFSYTQILRFVRKRRKHYKESLLWYSAFESHITWPFRRHQNVYWRSQHYHMYHYNIIIVLYTSSVLSPVFTLIATSALLSKFNNLFPTTVIDFNISSSYDVTTPWLIDKTLNRRTWSFWVYLPDNGIRQTRAFIKNNKKRGYQDRRDNIQRING